MLLFANLFEPVQQLSQLYNTVQSAAAVAAQAVQADGHRARRAEHRARSSCRAKGELAAHDVTFTYDGAERPRCTTCPSACGRGERLALVGPTGAGKSTLAKLLSRLYDPTDGSRQLRRRRRARCVARRRCASAWWWCRRRASCSAAPSATTSASPAPTPPTTRCAPRSTAIGVLERFEEFPEGLDTEVRERGSRLSAGERQLVSLARAALVDPAVLVLDEATSNLDPGTEAVVERALERLMEGRTVIVVAHRLRTVRRADRIAVIDRAGWSNRARTTNWCRAGGRYAALADAWAQVAARGRPETTRGRSARTFAVEVPARWLRRPCRR